MDINVDCSFCQEINGYTDFSFFEIYLKDKYNAQGLNDRIVAESNNFFLMPMVGPLVPGYLLIVSKKHYFSFSHMNDELLNETQLIQQAIIDLFNKLYCNPVFFEHGPMSDVCKGGSCSVHAHLHCVAVQTDIYENLCQTDYDLIEISSLNEIQRQAVKNSPYLYYENQKGKKYLIEVEEIESQYIRKQIAKQMGFMDKAEWSQNIQYEWMIDIIKQAKPYFNDLKGTSIWL